MLVCEKVTACFPILCCCRVSLVNLLVLVLVSQLYGGHFVFSDPTRLKLALIVGCNLIQLFCCQQGCYSFAAPPPYLLQGREVFRYCCLVHSFCILLSPLFPVVGVPKPTYEAVLSFLSYLEHFRSLITLQSFMLPFLQQSLLFN